MKDKRKPGQSQLDYLWINFGPYQVSNIIGEEDSIPTTMLLETLVEGLKNNSLNTLKVVGNNLIGTNITGNQIFSIGLDEIVSKGKLITNFGRRYITNTDVENGSAYPVDTPVYYLKFSDNTELVAQIDSYKGAESDNIVVTINNGNILASLKINNGDSIVTLNNTSLGVQANLKIAEPEGSLVLSKELEGLRARIILDNKNKKLNFKLLSLSDYLYLPTKDSTTVYFIEGKNYFYFGEHKIGEGETNLDKYYTKEEIDKLIEEAAISGIDLTDYVKFINNDNRKQIILGNNDNILGRLVSGNPVNLMMLSKWDVADFGSAQTHTNLNSSDKVTINDKDIVATEQLLEDNYYTKNQIDNINTNLATIEYVQNSLAGVGMEWNNIN